ncbi:MAG: TGS domain-containing protein [Clostridiales bacterium]|nr:MAG: TGS domain-containing protein [Clostridiales bacterium]
MEIENGASVYDAAKKVSEGLARAALGARVDGEVKELTFKLEKKTQNLKFSRLTTTTADTF